VLKTQKNWLELLDFTHIKNCNLLPIVLNNGLQSVIYKEVPLTLIILISEILKISKIGFFFKLKKIVTENIESSRIFYW
jgi:hypothetical protein